VAFGLQVEARPFLEETAVRLAALEFQQPLGDQPLLEPFPLPRAVVLSSFVDPGRIGTIAFLVQDRVVEQRGFHTGLVELMFLVQVHFRTHAFAFVVGGDPVSADDRARLFLDQPAFFVQELVGLAPLVLQAPVGLAAQLLRRF
jgi:hypothetical protein